MDFAIRPPSLRRVQKLQVGSSILHRIQCQRVAHHNQKWRDGQKRYRSLHLEDAIRSARQVPFSHPLGQLQGPTSLYGDAGSRGRRCPHLERLQGGGWSFQVLQIFRYRPYERLSSCQ